MNSLHVQVDASLARPYRCEAVPQWELGYLYDVLQEILVGAGYGCTYSSPTEIAAGGLLVHLDNPYTTDRRVRAGVPSAVITIDPHLAYIRSTNFHYQDYPPYTFCTTVQELLDHLRLSAARYKELALRAARERELRLYEEEITYVSAYCANCLYSNDRTWAQYCGAGLSMTVGCTQREPLYCITRYPPLEE